MARSQQKLDEALNLKKYPAKQKMHEEVIVFVHFFDGSPKLLQRHIDLVNQLGFDAYAYQVAFHLKERRLHDFLPKANLKRLGLKNFWSKDLQHILDQIPGKKILYAFSNPASAAFEVAKNKNNQVCAVVCDSGPFFDLLRCSRNLIKDYFDVKNPLLNIPGAIAGTIALAPLHENYLNADLAALPKDFPVLSIRGWKDNLVPAKSIEKVFEKHQHLDLEVLNLPEAGHLNGLKDFPDVYKPVVENFLLKVCRD
tara:strand:+ start:647 stop:1408 length:762 start_codon:yes stop_codon:yes gene_type:complete